MRELRGKVAAVTGAASGLGRAMALAFADEGMHVALSDVADAADTLAQVEKRGVSAVAMKLDVSHAAEVEAFAELIDKELGRAQVVCNNAGIINPPGTAAYNVSKHAVVALSETLYHDLRERQSAIGVSVLCPAYVPTGIADSERNRPAGLAPMPKTRETLAREAMLKKAVASGRLSADDVARAVVLAVKEERFYVLTHPRIKGAIRARMEDILEERAPRNPMAL